MSEDSNSAGKASTGMLAILYDGSCDMCRASVDGINKFDNSGRIEPLDLTDPDARAKFPDLKLENLLEELHAVDERGRVFRGARAINEILRRQSGIKGLLAYMWYIPGYAWLADRQYKRIAATRYQRDASGRLKSPTPTDQ
ncbi:MAG: putative thiol-disulfide oxidoreductase [Candidatus Binatus sp.]|jgi:predicted DCC family thiol-disulfide oxidoreductase YuxK|nr:putative thiol-disulfide oxidoreductase [Candidatus Binatus sp.]